MLSVVPLWNTFLSGFSSSFLLNSVKRKACGPPRILSRALVFFWICPCINYLQWFGPGDLAEAVVSCRASETVTSLKKNDFPLSPPTPLHTLSLGAKPPRPSGVGVVDSGSCTQGKPIPGLGKWVVCRREREWPSRRATGLARSAGGRGAPGCSPRGPAGESWPPRGGGDPRGRRRAPGTGGTWVPGLAGGWALPGRAGLLAACGWLHPPRDTW